MPWAEVKAISQLAHIAEFNVRLDIMPDEGTDAERKRFISRKIAHLTQTLKRRGRRHVGVTVHEKTATADLHGHHLFRLEPSDFDILASYDGTIIRPLKFRRDQREEKVNYATKQRVALPPDFEKTIKHRRQRGVAFRGKRVSYTEAALALMAPARGPVTRENAVMELAQHQRGAWA